MMSKRHYDNAEQLLRQIAKTNKRSFDVDAFERLKHEQEKVCFPNRKNDVDHSLRLEFS